MIDGPLTDFTWAKSGDGGEPGFAGFFPELGEALLLSMDRLVPRWVGRSVKPPHWAIGWFTAVSQEQPELAWRVILALVERSRSDKDLAWIGAGPIETLLQHRGPTVVERMEQQARRDQRFKAAVSGVWRSSIAEEVWTKIQLASVPN